MTIRLLRLTLCATIALITLSTGAPAAAATVHPDGSTLRWGDCPTDVTAHPRQQCAALLVPLDYRRPHGRQITITLSRIRAADPARRLGTLVLNPGGPGVGGLSEPSDRYGPSEPPELRDRYDLVGFDARGIRHSTPVTCGLPAPNPLVRYPAPDGSIEHTISYAKQTADACRRHSADVLPHITTANTARDLDRIRAALGEQRISYLGLSYGTYLGAVYATLFPHRTDRVVLDSAIDPDRVGYDFVRLGALGLAQRLPDATRWIADRHQTYRLGRTPEQVHRRYRALTAALDSAPVAHPQGPLTGNWLRHYTLSMLRLRETAGFADLAEIWQYLAERSTATAPVTTRADQPIALTPTDNRKAVELAVGCGDVAWPRDINHYIRAVRADRHRFPDDAGRSANITPCAFWPAPVEAPVRVADRGPRNILILQNLRDPATPWTSGYGLRRALGHRSTMISADSGGHLVIGTNQCATNLALRYLTTDARTLPRDQNCPPTPAGPTP
ncbi:alpha/beta fold hydrolase [Actinoplanes sp. NEAU-A12]|uniref:Alpha/beta fold hydrolase n=1 Tax=Actinoplanes sandaracinus TaxID=3045177 RepID=A0ABT6WWU0_9ACTN|nr:alpha/beta fold hydrolase [Actinoplanes sandaracinus]MDI6104090.1 alpha/beta fold hydrolase [Actinoplanes sandaracinus]